MMVTGGETDRSDFSSKSVGALRTDLSSLRIFLGSEVRAFDTFFVVNGQFLVSLSLERDRMMNHDSIQMVEQGR